MTIGCRIVVGTIALAAFVPACAHDVSEEVGRIAELIQLRPGMQLAEVGAGNGEFSEGLANRVGRGGHVFVNEIDDGELIKIRRRIERSDLTNMSLVEGGVTDTRLPGDCCDGILLRYVYHHFSEPEDMLASLRRSLSLQGVLIVIEKLERGGHGISLDDMIEQLTADGFRLVSRHPEWGRHERHHAAVFALR